MRGARTKLAVGRKTTGMSVKSGPMTNPMSPMSWKSGSQLTPLSTDESFARPWIMNDSLFQAASWSLDTLMREHPPLLAICERMFETSELSENEHVALAIVLARVAPERWGVQIDPATNAATVHRKL